jgi:hypothetical protein
MEKLTPCLLLELAKKPSHAMKVSPLALCTVGLLYRRSYVSRYSQNQPITKVDPSTKITCAHLTLTDATIPTGSEECLTRNSRMRDSA